MQKMMLSKKVRDNEGDVWNVDEITEQVWQDCKSQISLWQIWEAVEAVAAKFQDARVKTYVPIFIRREVRELLYGKQAVESDGMLGHLNTPNRTKNQVTTDAYV